MAQPTPTTRRTTMQTSAGSHSAGQFTSTSERPIAAVQRALAVLECLAAEPGDLGTNEIARRVASNASSVSRLLATLARDEYVRRIPSTGRYRLGLRLVELGHSALARVDLREVARPHLLALTEVSGETATLSVPGEATPMTVDFVQSPSSVRSVAQLGRPAVPHATATGKVFLAYRDVMRDRHGEIGVRTGENGVQTAESGVRTGEDRVRAAESSATTGENGERVGEYAERSLIAYTHKTITDPRELAEELAAVRAHGFAQALGERESELNAIAVPVLAAGGELVAMLGVQGPASRFDPAAMEAVLDRLREHGQQLAAHVAPPHG